MVVINVLLGISRPLDGVQLCIKSLREQMADLQSQVYEHARTSSSWKYKLGFSCEKCDMKWELEHYVKDIDSTHMTAEELMDINFIKPVPKCNCSQTKTKKNDSTNEFSDQ
jgi:hypothetical protein